MKGICDNCGTRTDTTSDGQRDLCNHCFYDRYLRPPHVLVMAVTVQQMKHDIWCWCEGMGTGYQRGINFGVPAGAVAAVSFYLLFKLIWGQF